MRILRLFLVIATLISLSFNTALGAQEKSTKSLKIKTQKKGSYSKLSKAKPQTRKHLVKRATGKKAKKLPPVFYPKVTQATGKDYLEPVEVLVSKDAVSFPSMPHFSAVYNGKMTGVTKKNDFVFYSLNPTLQKKTSMIVSRSRAPHVAVVAMEPKTGRILALDGKSISIDNIVTHAGFPAASLFKVITAAAGIEQKKVSPDSLINFRGGIHLLDRSNAIPDPSRDRFSMSLEEAIGKSCNPVFAHVALNFLNPTTLQKYANLLGFNGTLGFDIKLPISSAFIPVDQYGFGRTAAGFGDVYISPIHAAALISAVANKGILPKPSIVDTVQTKDGALLYQNKPSSIKRSLNSHTAEVLFNMLESTTTLGTSKKAFTQNGKPALSYRVAGKTGTLRGDNPNGLNNWFIGAAPIENPKIAIAVIVVNPGDASSKASRIAKELIEDYLGE